MKTPLSVLIVDDEEAFATVLAMDLQTSERFTVRMAASGEEGMRMLMENPIDIILLDYYLGPMTGIQFLQWMNDNELDTPVIMLTAAGTEEVAVKAMKFGAYDYARKERLELHHLPILLEGVHERYLFRKEAKARDEKRIEEEKQRIAIQMFQTTVRTIAHHVNNSLAIIMLRSSITERHITKSLDPATAEPILQLVSDLRKQSSVIEAVVRSLVELSDVVYTKYAGDQAIIDIHTQIEKKLHQIQSKPHQN
ncbi:MAG TPA: response regulator [Bacteroidota bacterium]|nr:response regulator [Bacteroidota bacterium]